MLPAPQLTVPPTTDDTRKPHLPSYSPMECPPQSTPAPAPPVATEPAAEPDTLSEPSFEDRYWNFSTLPRNLIPHTLQDAPALHVFPPAYPSFYERIRTRPEARYALPSPRHCLTEATHLLMEQAGSVQYVDPRWGTDADSAQVPCVDRDATEHGRARLAANVRGAGTGRQKPGRFRPAHVAQRSSHAGERVVGHRQLHH